MTTTYYIVRDLDQTAAEIGDMLKKKHLTARHMDMDKTCFSGEGVEFRVDTYQVFDSNRWGNITINIYFSRPDTAKDDLQIKVTLFPPYMYSPTRVMKRLQRDIEAVILGPEKTA